ncbi:type II secretion system F family protein [uncultured Jatrophihabitans sp.]|uniref:type II secretion system F family protein n=1 Tax=uncultured Jatrophihabitans sp. TaxID=1610747 RepID=UPI0035C94E90
MITALFCGGVVGAGVFWLVMIYARPKPGLETLVHRIDVGAKSMSTRTVTALEQESGPSRVDSLMKRLGDRLEVFAAERNWRLGRVRTDLGIMNRTLGSFLAAKVVYGLGLFLLAPIVYSVLRLGGIGLPPVLPALAAVAFGLFGFFLPDLALRGEAAERREDFRRVVGIFLDLVAMNLAGGRGLPEALLTASTISENWALVRIRQALNNARLFGVTPWESLSELGNTIGLDELRDLSAALSLAAEDGAKIKQSLSARAATLRRRELAEVEGEAGEKSQSMLVAQLLICMGFLIFLAYPSISQLAKQ